jgi:hypothetical protein
MHKMLKKMYNKKGEELSMFLMWDDSRCLNWFIFTTFCSNTYKYFYSIWNLRKISLNYINNLIWELNHEL